MIKDIDKIMERVWYHPYCNNDEIDRILNPQNATDYLLQQRANIVADNPRYWRVYRCKSIMYPNWSFEKSFKASHYLNVIKNLSAEDKTYCESIAYGDIFSDDANGYAENNKEWGKIIYLNESLQFFMKFCNLALFNYQDEGIDIPIEIRQNALRIAIRIMMKQEAMDFFLDPRGIVPKTVGIRIHEPIEYELQYIAGHEFSHHLCHHFNDSNLAMRTVLSINDNEYIKQVYNISQKQEFEADLASINRPLYTNEDFNNILTGALIWFISLDLSETAQEIVVPSCSFTIKTHPSAKERFDYLVNNVDIPRNFNTDLIEGIIKNALDLKEWLKEDLSVNYELYDCYGSVYLDKPNTKWRGRELIDRVDY